MDPEEFGLRREATMPGRRRTAMGIAGVLGLAVVAGSAIVGFRGAGRAPGGPSAANFDAKSPLPELIPALRDSDARALTALFQRLSARSEAPAKAVTEVEAQQWLEALAALRTGYVKFGGYG